MISGVHTILYTTDAEATRGFFKDVLGLESVDAGGGWLVFALPPGELAAHPADAPAMQLYLMCDDIHATVEQLRAKGVTVAREIVDQRWGLVTSIEVPGAGEIGLYEPRHPTAIDRRSR